MTTTPDARPVSEARLSELIRDCEEASRQAALFFPEPGRVHEHSTALLSALRELQSLRAEKSALAHDLVRHINIGASQATEMESLRARIASLEKLMRTAPRRSCEQSCSAYWGSPRDCHCGAVAWNAAIDAAMKERA